ncbi:hypothetical protein TH468_07785 [Thalassospira sp. MCCC 1A03138]|nr:hypothetical protein TH468_07785 [Thalassospira sp. MCCC 1A03138]
MSLKHGAYSQGRVKFLTGGNPDFRKARERLPKQFGRVSRSGEIPEPTVTVRMGEDKAWRITGEPVVVSL